MSDIARDAGVSRQALYLHFGSRTGLLLATVQYVDDQEGFRSRSRAACTASRADEALDAFITFWAGYVASIHGLAKALLAARQDDEAAAAAWEDRMGGLRRICRLLASRLKEEELLSDAWSVEAATDFLWTMFSIQTWENLRVECRWSERRYVRAVREAIGGALLA